MPRKKLRSSPGKRSSGKIARAKPVARAPAALAKMNAAAAASPPSAGRPAPRRRISALASGPGAPEAHRAMALAAAPAPQEPVLELTDIQGNILAGFNKDFQSFLFIRIN